jgi:hypothetical protein
MAKISHFSAPAARSEDEGVLAILVTELGSEQALVSFASVVVQTSPCGWRLKSR